MCSLRRFHIPAAVALILAASLLTARARIAAAQDDQTSEEIVANLAAGRVIVGVFHDAIVVGTIESKVESASELPAIVPISTARVGVLLGAVNWYSPSTRTAIANLPYELPHLRYHAAGTSEGPHLIAPPSGDATASDIEQTGLGVMSRLTEVSSNIHGHIDVKPDEPLAELVLVDYVEAYGPEAWLMTYEIEQQPERGDFWVTRVKRPKYDQLWPPEKTAPHTLFEIDYPLPSGGNTASSTLRALLAANSKELSGIRSSSAMSASCDALLSTTINRENSDSAMACLRNAMDLLAKGAKEELAVITPGSGMNQGGIKWIIAPPADARPKPTGPRDENAPSLQRPPSAAPSLKKPNEN
jgi:hypothetical protein